MRFLTYFLPGLNLLYHMKICCGATAGVAIFNGRNQRHGVLSGTTWMELTMESQCQGITRSGERCKISRALIDGYCHLHRKRGTAAASIAAEPPPRPEESAVSPQTHYTEFTPPSPDKRYTPLILSAFVLLFLLLVAGIKKVFSWRSTM